MRIGIYTGRIPQWAWKEWWRWKDIRYYASDIKHSWGGSISSLHAFRKLIIFLEWVKFVAKIYWLEIWTECWNFSLKNIGYSLVHGVCLLSKWWNCCYSVHQPFFDSYGDFQAFCRQKKNKTYIAKPDSGCQGKGIFVTKNPKVGLYLD